MSFAVRSISESLYYDVIDSYYAMVVPSSADKDAW